MSKTPLNASCFFIWSINLAIVINGKEIAAKLEEEIATEVSKYKPCLAVCLVGDNPASAIYVNNKRKACARVGIQSKVIELPSHLREKELISRLDDLGSDPKIHGILVQLPLPDHINRNNILAHINPRKDVDGFHPFNSGRLQQGEPSFVPCTPLAIQFIIKHTGIDIIGKHVCIINDSIIVGKPLAALMLQDRATVTLCNEHTNNIKEITRLADVVVVAVGRRPKFVLTDDYVKDGVIVVDVGITRMDDGKVKGDVDFDSVVKKAGWLTPVPSGVGPLTISMLLKNTLIAAKRGANVHEVICS